ncbi:hypothetical protein I7I50_04631 [Histoplasma capsulatum G186AR]|uniref:C2H2-type domain-containing protein n=1 Tax=Ajellomyces capsulatus TaxID=5037 RepID=A0A8H8CZ52_AJECA|nr:hypothetical protein I7I52_05540 [Histoplasma capsulatum]QSS75485.1 hypothetical protein I7I50_04631 [Histoplasma capsulatum G186AR]
MLVQQYIKICPTCSPVLSEPPVPALEGFPNVIEFDKRMASYIKHLPDEFRDKATISWSMAGKIGKTLLGDTTEPVEFQGWSKKMFTLGRINGQLSVFREGKPIATEEKLFKILTTAHQKCEHGDQKKTSAEANELYSWVPEELIREFIHICPTCRLKFTERSFVCGYDGCKKSYQQLDYLRWHQLNHNPKDIYHRDFPNWLQCHKSTDPLATKFQAGSYHCERINSSTGEPCNSILSNPHSLRRHEDEIHNPCKQKMRYKGKDLFSQ